MRAKQRPGSAYANDGNNVNVGAYIPLELKLALQEIAHRNRRSVSEEIRRALEEHIVDATDCLPSA